MRSSSVGGRPKRSDRPGPRLSNRISRANEPMRSGMRVASGSSHMTSWWETKPETSTMSSGPSPITW